MKEIHDKTLCEAIAKNLIHRLSYRAYWRARGESEIVNALNFPDIAIKKRDILWFRCYFYLHGDYVHLNKLSFSTTRKMRKSFDLIIKGVETRTIEQQSAEEIISLILRQPKTQRQLEQESKL